MVLSKILFIFHFAKMSIGSVPLRAYAISDGLTKITGGVHFQAGFVDVSVVVHTFSVQNSLQDTLVDIKCGVLKGDVQYFYL